MSIIGVAPMLNVPDLTGSYEAIRAELRTKYLKLFVLFCFSHLGGGRITGEGELRQKG